MPTWLSLDNAQKIAGILAVVIGGIWVYYNYFKGRTHKPRLEPTISGELFNKNRKLYLIATAKLKNAGLSKVTIEQEGTGLRILSYINDPNQVNGFVKEKWLDTPPIFLDHEWVEPGKGIDDALLTTIDSEIIAIRLELIVMAKDVEFKAVTIVKNNSSNLKTSTRFSSE